VKKLAPHMRSLTLSCNGALFSSDFVTLLIGRRSIHQRFDPSAFNTKRVDTADSDRDSGVFPFDNSSSSCFLTSIASSLLNLLCFAFGNRAPSSVSISKS
jgi:hypothetical protein